MNSYISNEFFFENDFVNEEYLKGYNEGVQDAMQALKEAEDEEETNKIENLYDVYDILSKNSNYKPFLKLNGNDLYFESKDKDLVIEFEINIEENSKWDKTIIARVDTYRITGGQYDERARLTDVPRMLKSMRKLSDEGKICKKAFLSLLKDIQNDKFENIQLSYSKGSIQI